MLLDLLIGPRLSVSISEVCSPISYYNLAFIICKKIKDYYLFFVFIMRAKQQINYTRIERVLILYFFTADGYLTRIININYK